VRRAIPLVAVLAGCSLREPRVSYSACSANSQCSNANVCFLGQCRAPAANLSVVSVEVRPPSGSAFALQEVQVDLRQRVVNDFPLSPPLAMTGSVTKDGAPVPGATVTFIDHAPLIPDRVDQVVSVTGTTGAYQAPLPQRKWDVLLQPPSPDPPLRAGPIDASSSSATLDFALPGAATLTRIDGGLLADGGPLADAGPVPVQGASVTAVDSKGLSLSASQVSDADGGYTFLLPQDAGNFLLQVGPPAGADGGLPLDPLPLYPPQPYANPLTLPLPPAAALDVDVLDSTGAPVPSARVYVRSVGTLWTLARSVVADGGVSTLPLREGDYLLQAAPPADPSAPALSDAKTITLPQPAPVVLTCPPKVKRFGQIVGPDGRPVGANFQILATRLSDALVPTRTAYTTPTDGFGTFHLVADAGNWRFEIVPPAGTPLPRAILGVFLDGADLGESQMPSLQISKALHVGGTVTGRLSPGGADTLVANAMVSFFSVDLNGHSVFLGSSPTDALGHYDAYLPDVAQPGP
jgi:hypothetical protein